MFHQTDGCTMLQGAMKVNLAQTVTIPVIAQTVELVTPFPGRVYVFMVTLDPRVVRPVPMVGMVTTVRNHVTVSMEGCAVGRKGDVNVCQVSTDADVKMVYMII